MTKKPCAFCGSIEKDNPRTKGHVLQQSMYPEIGCDSVQRITVPECQKCKAIWQDAEDEFRTFMVFPSADLNEHAEAKWVGPISRAHQREEDGIARLRALMRHVAEVKIPNGKEVRVFPHDSDKVLLVIRKMVRGLCHYHGLATQVPDHQVLTGLFTNTPPEGATPVDFSFLPGIFRYSYFHLYQHPTRVHVDWLLTFYDRVSFIGMVSTDRHLEWEKQYPAPRKDW